MVAQNYVLYVNKKNQLRTVEVLLSDSNGDVNFKFSINEKHLVCGLILNGIPVKGDLLKNFPFKPIEKYLFEFSNIHFTLPEMEFSQENMSYDFTIQFDLEIPVYPYQVNNNLMFVNYWHNLDFTAQPEINAIATAIQPSNPLFQSSNDVRYQDLRIYVNGVLNENLVPIYVADLFNYVFVFPNTSYPDGTTFQFLDTITLTKSKIFTKGID